MKTKINCKKMRPAFNLIEILVAVAILSYAIIYVLKIYSENHKYVVYLSERNKQAMEDSLYVTPNVLRYDKSSKSAEELLHSQIRPEELLSREILKQTKRSITVSKDLIILPPPNIDQASGIANEVGLKEKAKTNYWFVKINRF